MSAREELKEAIQQSLAGPQIQRDVAADLVLNAIKNAGGIVLVPIPARDVEEGQRFLTTHTHQARKDPVMKKVFVDYEAIGGGSITTSATDREGWPRGIAVENPNDPVYIDVLGES